MHYSKLFSNGFLIACLCTPAVSFAADKVSACVENGKTLYAAKNYDKAKDAFARCVKMDASNVDALLSLAGVLLTQDDLNGAEKYFNEALKNMKRNSPYWSYVYSMLGDIALKRQQNDQALKMYSKSLEYNAANVNSLVGKGVIVEYQGDKQGAAEYYRSAIAVEPMNLIARKRLVNLEPDYLTDEEMLEALKQRYAVKPEATELTEADRALFSAIHRDEQRQGVTYLKNKYPKMPAEYVVTLNKGTGFEREILTLDGYKALEKSIGQDAFNVFNRAGVAVRDIYSLRDMKGNKIYTPESTLTDSGFYVYTEALKNRKRFLLPSESVPPTPAFLAQLEQRQEELKKAGYIEISRSEVKMLENQTFCSEDTLRKNLGLYILNMSKNERRYFVQSRTSDDKAGVSYYYVMSSRKKRNPKVKVPANALVETYALYGYTLCSSDGELIQ